MRRIGEVYTETRKNVDELVMNTIAESASKTFPILHNTKNTNTIVDDLVILQQKRREVLNRRDVDSIKLITKQLKSASAVENKKKLQRFVKNKDVVGTFS